MKENQRSYYLLFILSLVLFTSCAKNVYIKESDFKNDYFIPFSMNAFISKDSLYIGKYGGKLEVFIIGNDKPIISIEKSWDDRLCGKNNDVLNIDRLDFGTSNNDGLMINKIVNIELNSSTNFKYLDIKEQSYGPFVHAGYRTFVKYRLKGQLRGRTLNWMQKSLAEFFLPKMDKYDISSVYNIYPYDSTMLLIAYDRYFPETGKSGWSVGVLDLKNR